MDERMKCEVNLPIKAPKQFTEQSQVRETHHRSDGSDTGSNSGGRWTTEKKPQSDVT